MKITFTLTKRDSWNYHKYAKWKMFIHAPVRLIAAYTLSVMQACLIWAALFYLFMRDFWYGLAIGIFATLLGMIWYGLSARKRHYKDLALKPTWIGSRFVELGKYDLLWGNSEGVGRYYHWSAFTDIAETSSYFYLTLRSKNVFIIPKTAFPGSADAEDFGVEMRSRWEAAKHKQRYLEQEVKGTWPPAPRPRD